MHNFKAWIGYQDGREYVYSERVSKEAKSLKRPIIEKLFSIIGLNENIEAIYMERPYNKEEQLDLDLEIYIFKNLGLVHTPLNYIVSAYNKSTNEAQLFKVDIGEFRAETAMQEIKGVVCTDLTMEQLIEKESAHQGKFTLIMDKFSVEIIKLVATCLWNKHKEDGMFYMRIAKEGQLGCHK